MNEFDNPRMPVRLSDYVVSDFSIDRVKLFFSINSDHVFVKSVLDVRRVSCNVDNDRDLFLNGEDLQPVSFKINGSLLGVDEFEVSSEGVKIFNVPDSFTFESECIIYPAKNMQLSGLYKTQNNYYTQCESQGFRRITYFLDRPDIMSKYTVTIIADKKQYPVLLSNGELIESCEVGDGRHKKVWMDVQSKSCYLFALVVGDFDRVFDEYITRFGKLVKLCLYVEKGNIDKTTMVLPSLKKVMKWEEDYFECGYEDYPEYNIVAAGDFNSGAMENKTLNIFNTKYIFANSNTASDKDHLRIISVVAHEYLHHWTGNTVTCRDWFQITLKEGLTSFRDQLFFEKTFSESFGRLDSIEVVKNNQFIEDSGPNAHPIKPQQYISVDNLYTLTVYDKGAEVCRMLYNILGETGFKKGLKLYLSRNKFKAVTTDDFIEAMENANERSLAQFKRWYSQIGTPIVKVSGNYDSDNKVYTMTVFQDDPIVNGHKKVGEELFIPFLVRLIAKNGAFLTDEKLLNLSERKHVFTFNVDEEPVLSLLRRFSAPVKIDFDYTEEDLSILAIADDDIYVRWNSAQKIIIDKIKEFYNGVEERISYQNINLGSYLIRMFEELLSGDYRDLYLLSRMLRMPPVSSVVNELNEINIQKLLHVYFQIKKCIGVLFKNYWFNLYNELKNKDVYEISASEIGIRAFRAVCLEYLLMNDEERFYKLAVNQVVSGSNFTDIFSGMIALNDHENEHRTSVMKFFYDKYGKDRLTICKWFSLIASSRIDSTYEKVVEICNSDIFDSDNPNMVYSLLSVFGSNFSAFHRNDGKGYKFLSDQIVRIDKKNRKVSGRIAANLCDWKKYSSETRKMMKDSLESLIKTEGLSSNVYELVNKSLKE